MITEDYVSFEIARLLKEKGFDGECRAFWKDWKGEIRLCSCNNAHMFEYCHNSMLERYNDAEETNIAAPTLQMAMKWLREEHNLVITILPILSRIDHSTAMMNGWRSDVSRIKLSIYGSIVDVVDGIDGGNIPNCDTYEQACEAAIKYCLENLI